MRHTETHVRLSPVAAVFAAAMTDALERVRFLEKRRNHWRAYARELEEENGKAGATQELSDEKISALTEEVEKRREDETVLAARVEELEAELKRSNDRLLGVQFEIQRLATGAINIPSIPHELKEHIRRIHALAHPAEKG